MSESVTRNTERTVEADGMLIDYHVPIEMDDGVVLRADVFRPQREGRYPVVLSYGPYAKGLSFQQGYAPQWNKMVADFPDAALGSTNKYQNWEVVDPEKWVPFGYVCVRIDSRGTGWSPGTLDVWSVREAQDIYQAIEWAATRPWSTGKIGMTGISYYAINEWQVAGLQPPHLTALVPWEGAADFYRDMSYHGGIYCVFQANWYPQQVENVQYGLGERALKNPNTGESVAGPVTLSDRELTQNRRDLEADINAHPLDDAWHQARSADWSKVQTPFLSTANWGGQGLHPRGNFEAFTEAATEQKWLEAHGDSHWSLFYTDYGVALQRRFFDHFLKGDGSWAGEPRVRLQVRRVDGFVERHEDEWPLARTQWTKFYLDAASGRLQTDIPAASEASYPALGEGLDFSMTVERETEITGPMAAKLFISSSTADADLFLVVRVFNPAGEEIVFQGALDPNTPIAQGWLRASHRKLDPVRSKPHRPFHSHDQVSPLEPGQTYEVDVEIWPSSIVVPAGWRVTLSVRGKDYEYQGPMSDFARSFHYASKGCGPFLHPISSHRPEELFGGDVTVHCGGDTASYLLLPVIPEQS
ncbi:MAG TPA: CocE/NonD family hydrolase [Candidatus Acidoferrales bacterium]|nr:CocE/NonD family hydrolase [Candidatus Acidoferrales bacterium]